MKIMRRSPYGLVNPRNVLKFGDVVLFKSNLVMTLCTPFDFSHVGLAINANLILELSPGCHLRFRRLATNEKYFVRRLVGTPEPDLRQLNAFFRDADDFKYSHTSYIKECVFRIAQRFPFVFVPPPPVKSRYHNCASFVTQVLRFLGIISQETSSSLLPDDFAKDELPTTSIYSYSPIVEH